MTSVADAKFDALRRVPLTGSVGDMLLDWYQANGATSSSRTDAKREFLDARGYSAERDINQAWRLFLRDRGYTDLNDGNAQFWVDDMPLNTIGAYTGQIFGDSLVTGVPGNVGGGYGKNLDAEVSPQTVTLDRNGQGLAPTSFIREELFEKRWSALNGNFCIVEGGGNDILGNETDPSADLQANISYMVDKVKAAGQLCILIGLTPMKSYVGWNATKQIWIDANESWMASTYPDEYFNVYSLLEDPGNPDQLLPIFAQPDGLHLTDAAYAVTDAFMAPRFDGIL